MIAVEQMPGYGPPTPVPIYQWEREFITALELYRKLGPSRVLEIGTYHGGTLYHWLRNARSGTTVVSLDSYAVGVDNRHLYDEWTPEGVQLHVYAGNSHDQNTADEIAAHRPFDWVFIDAGHYYQEVLRDWELYGPMSRPGGVVLFHDILPPTKQHPEIEVATLWEEIKLAHPTLEIIADRGAEWGGIGVVLK